MQIAEVAQLHQRDDHAISIGEQIQAGDALGNDVHWNGTSAFPIRSIWAAAIFDEPDNSLESVDIFSFEGCSLT